MHHPDRILQPFDPSTTVSLAGGMPLATATVWVIENMYLPPGVTLEAVPACAFGIIGAAVFGELWLTFQRLLRKIGGPLP
jgi:hypothetical protein